METLATARAFGGTQGVCRHDILIVGSGHAGAQAAIALRQRNYAGTIGIIGEETELPYERPPLSKEYLSGAKSFERILIRPASFWPDRAITMLPGRRVVALDPAARTVTTQTAETIGYRALIWAAGGHARRLACAEHDIAGVHTVRSRADVDRMIAELPTTERAVVIGGGYVGLEAAAVLVTLGKHVTVLEAAPHVLARVAGAPLSRFYEAEHRAHGVDLRLHAQVVGIEETDGRATGVRLVNGEVIPAQMVIVGIGIVPAVAPLLAAGAEGGNGVSVDAQCRTTLPHVFAIGDCALHANPYAPDHPVRIESVGNATDQASLVARILTGEPAPDPPVPWFWSNQYDLKLQTVGLSTGHDDIVIRGDPATRAFSLIYLRDHRVIALDCVNTVKDYVGGRKLVVDGAVIDCQRLADPAIPLKSSLPRGSPTV